MNLKDLDKYMVKRFIHDKYSIIQCNCGEARFIVFDNYKDKDVLACYDLKEAEEVVKYLINKDE